MLTRDCSSSFVAFQQNRQCVPILTHTHTRTHTCARVHTHTHARERSRTHTHTHTYTRARQHIHSHTYTHTTATITNSSQLHNHPVITTLLPRQVQVECFSLTLTSCVNKVSKVITIALHALKIFKGYFAQQTPKRQINHCTFTAV